MYNFQQNARKFQKIPLSGKEYKKTNLFLKKGNLGIKILENTRLSLNQIEALKKALLRMLKPSEKFFLNNSAPLTITQKTGDVRMGKGKGVITGIIFKMRAGSFLLEVNTFRKNKEKLLQQLSNLIKKLPMKCKVISF